jgi:hypothetical protein
MSEAPADGGFFPLVYDELRRLAAAKLAGEPVGHTLDATALVHEAYPRLGDAAFPGRMTGPTPSMINLRSREGTSSSLRAVVGRGRVSREGDDLPLLRRSYPPCRTQPTETSCWASSRCRPTSSPATT